MLSEKTISVLNTLITINNERGEGYRIASGKSSDLSLSELFAQLYDTSINCQSELNSAITKLGGSPSEANMIGGDFFSAWNTLQEALTKKDMIAILNSCLNEHGLATDAYLHALDNNSKDLNEVLISMIRIQHARFVANSNKIKAIKDSVL